MVNAPSPPTADPPKTTPPPTHRAQSVALYTVLAVVWLGDLAASGGMRTPDRGWLLPLLSGPVAAVLLQLPYRWLSLERRAWAMACGSLAVTGVSALRDLKAGGGWGMLESVCLLILIARTCRRTDRPYVTVALGIAVLLGPVRLNNPGVLAGSYSLAFGVAAVVALGCYLRVQDRRQARAMDSVRQAERMELARDLHDFVAHHVTGIVVQANAGLAVRATAPEHIEPILESIQKSGMETLDSMRRLVRVLREVDGTPRRPGELFTELAGMVSGFSGGEDGSDATLSVAAPARSARLAPEVELSVHRVVQESLTNARRHAPERRWPYGWTRRTDGCGWRSPTRPRPRRPRRHRSEAAGASGWWGSRSGWQRSKGSWRRAGHRKAAGGSSASSPCWTWPDQPSEPY